MAANEDQMLSHTSVLSTKANVSTQTMRSYLMKLAIKQTKINESVGPHISLLSQTSSSYLLTRDWHTLDALHMSYDLSKEITRLSKSVDAMTIDDSTTSFKSQQQQQHKQFDYEINSTDKQPVSWFISFDDKPKDKTYRLRPQSTKSKSLYHKPRNISKTRSDELLESNSNETLQEAFNRRCVDMRINSQLRVNRINTISDLRKRTADERLIQMAKQWIRQQESAKKVIKMNVIQPVFKSSIKRFFTHEEMRAQTERIYQNLPEVKAMKEKKKQLEKEKYQRILAQFYKYRLKDCALKGRLDWKITQSCLDSTQ